jgi:hypothetical protein
MHHPAPLQRPRIVHRRLVVHEQHLPLGGPHGSGPSFYGACDESVGGMEGEGDEGGARTSVGASGSTAVLGSGSQLPVGSESGSDVSVDRVDGKIGRECACFAGWIN